MDVEGDDDGDDDADEDVALGALGPIAAALEVGAADVPQPEARSAITIAALETIWIPDIGDVCMTVPPHGMTSSDGVRGGRVTRT
jgi:hypothetical protein